MKGVGRKRTRLTDDLRNRRRYWELKEEAEDGKLSLKADEPQVGQQYEDVERKLEYYHIIISLKELEILHQERRGQVKTMAMGHFNGILFHKSGPAEKQHTYQLLYLK